MKGSHDALSGKVAEIPASTRARLQTKPKINQRSDQI
jgi:hypothetical protein